VNLSEVSQSAILVLTCRAIESEKKNTVLNDPMAVLCLERLMSISSEEENNRIIKWKKMYAGINARDAKARALTARSFDRITNLFISKYPGCTVINLACGLDTRYWRIENENCKYIELDLPEMIELKKEILKDHLDYELIGCSVLDTSWIDKVTSNGNSGFLLLAEGLFYYLPRQDVIGNLQVMAQRFYRSQLVLDMAPEKFTKGLWKRLMQLEARVWGLDVSFVFGMNNPRDIESYANGFKVIGVEKGSVGSIITVSINAAQHVAAGDMAKAQRENAEMQL
jgi:O-methyltransferase involved in polyketide biosynthesis